MYSPSLSLVQTCIDVHVAALNNPTNPESSTSSATPSVTAMSATPLITDTIPTSGSLDSVLAPPASHMSRGVTPGDDSLGFSYEVFDPLNWVLDGIVDMPVGFNGGGFDLDAQTVGI